MKKYFMIGLGIVLALSLTLILYGAWLNERGEFQIAKRMSERSLELQGAKAEKRFIRPSFNLNVINFYSKDMTDAVALSEGRITECGNLPQEPAVSRRQHTRRADGTASVPARPTAR